MTMEKIGVLLVAAMAFGAISGAAEARIVCKNGWQLVSGNWIATPYCQEAQLGKVARQHGFKVSNATLRNNPNIKRNICQFVGRDIRVQQTCIDANSVGRRGF